MDSEVKIKYFISIWSFKSTRCGDGDTQGIRKISLSSQNYAFSWNGWAKCEQVYTEQIASDIW